MRLAAITRFPVKSLGGEPLGEAAVEARGLADDRRWLVIDARDRFVTRRELPAMARLGAVAVAGGLELAGPAGRCRVATPGPDAPVATATVWRDRVAVRLADPAAHAFLSAALGRPVRLAHQFDASHRPLDPAVALPGEEVSLADGCPLLVTATASLAALNAGLARPVTMARFRANLVVEGGEPWAEGGWRRLRVGAVELRVLRPCVRCVVVTQAPDTGERLDGDEPLATLRRLGQRGPGGVLFGQNAVAARPGRLRVGDPVVVVD